MEADDTDIDVAGEGENLFKSSLVQRIGIPQPDTLKNSDSNSDFISNIIPSFGRAGVYPLKFHDVLNDCNLPTNTEKSYMTNSNAETLKRFLQAENTYEGKIFCQKCLKRQCPDCSLLNKKYSQEEKETFQKMWNNVVLIKDDKAGYRVKASYLYSNDPHVVFAAENTNFNQALLMSKKVIH